MKIRPFSAALFSLALLSALAGCAKTQKEAARDITAEVEAYYKAHPDFFKIATAADLPQGLKWEDGHDVPEFGAPEAKLGGTLNFFLDDFPRTLRYIGPDANGVFRGFIFDDVTLTLIQKQPNTGQYFPGLAKQWALGADGRTMYFKLDPDARYSDGMPVKASDYFFAFFYYQSSYINEPWYNNYYTSNFTNITRYGDDTISISWKEPKPDIYDRVGGCGPIPQHFYKELGPDFPQRYQWTIEPTTGPYTVLPEDVHKGSYIDLTRVKNWWASDKRFYRDRYRIERFHFDIIRDRNKALEAFKRGDLDYFGLTTPPDQWYTQLPNTDPLVQQGYIHKVTFYNEIPAPTYGLYLNNAKPLLDNHDVRVGIAYATNFDLVNQTYFHGDYLRMQTSSDGYADVPFPNIHSRSFSVEKALESFAKAGFSRRGPDGVLVNDKGQRLSFTITTGYDRFREVLTILKQEAAKAGLEFKVEVLDNTTDWKKAQEKQHEIEFTGFNVGTPSYPDYWQGWHSSNRKPQTNNFTMTADPELDRLIDQYDRSTSMAQIRTIATSIEQKISEDASFIPGFVMPFYRVGYWRGIRWPKDFNVRASIYFWQYGVEWIDQDMRKETQAAKASGKTFPASIEVYDQWKPKTTAPEAVAR